MKISNVQTHLVRLPFDSSANGGVGLTAWPGLDHVLREYALEA